MTWTYEGNPFPAVNPCTGLPIPDQSISQPCIDTIRFLLGDTDGNDQLLADGEVLGLLTQNEASVYLAAIEGARSIAAKFARQADKQVGDLRISAHTRSKQYLDLIPSLEAQAMRHATATPYASGISVGDKETNAENDDNVSPAFSVGMMDDRGTSPRFGDRSEWDFDRFLPRG